MTHTLAFPMGPMKVDDAREGEHLGVKFVTHSIPNALNRFQQIRASEWRTGYGLPNTYAENHEDAATLARKEIERAGNEKISNALAKLPTLNHVAEDQIGGIA